MTERDKTYYIYVNNDQIKSKILEWYGKRELVPDTTLVLCNKRVESVEDPDRQRTLIINYHNGLTNHRGAIETLAQLKRHNYWTDMLGTIKRVIAECSVCNESKYERNPAITPQQVTETPTKHLDQVQADIWYWEGTKTLTMIDVATRLLFTKCIERRTSQKVKEGILEFCSVVGIPKLLTMDSGTEFNNRLVRKVLTELGIESHTTTPGHARSHGVIERLHLTLGEHMGLLEKSKKIKGPEAVARAALAYNRTIHSATSKTPMELMRAWCRVEKDLSIEEDMGAIADRIRDEKLKRTEKINKRKEYRKPRELKPGMKFFIKNLIRRRKSDPLYIGPYIVGEVLSRHRVILGKETWSWNKSIIRHLGEVRVRAKKSKECK
ncbi:hypothetical protein AAG570_002111 [Ranatra chinensis]|uniref:RNA-directed DNA polymerase n=1 Tax=Ranatra chinensis TaxID=642074 RepID=A0ABD0YTA6_9HEMI